MASTFIPSTDDDARITGRKKMARAQQPAAEFLIQQIGREKREKHNQRHIEQHILQGIEQEQAIAGILHEQVCIMLDAYRLGMIAVHVVGDVLKTKKHRLDQRVDGERQKTDDKRQHEEIPHPRPLFYKSVCFVFTHSLSSPLLRGDHSV